MKNQITLFLALLVSGLNLHLLNAQNPLQLIEMNGSQSSVPLPEIRKPGFKADSLYLATVQSGMQTYPHARLSVLSFRNYFAGVPGNEVNPPGD